MNFILFDIEATCWDGYHSNGIQEIIELGAISYDRFGEESGTFLEFVRPEINPRLSKYCMELTGITQNEVDSAADFNTVYDDFEDWVRPDSDTWFVSWGDFDLAIMNASCERWNNGSSFIQNHLDLQVQYANLKLISPRTSLVHAIEMEEWEFEGVPHRAMPDTRNMARIFFEFLPHWTLM